MTYGDKKREYCKKYYAEHRAERAAEYAKNKKDLGVSQSARRAAARLATFNAYGGPKCACCGETLFEGLTIDHIGGDGAKHRREIGRAAGASICAWLKKNNYPPGFQVLCYTCNCAKGTGDHCPHKDTK